MDEQRAWLRARRRRSLRIFAVILCLCVLFTTYPDILATLSVLAEEKPGQTQYVSGFAELPEEIREQTVPVGTGLEELSLPDTLEAVVTRESQSSEDGEKGPEDDGGDDTGENDGEETDGDTSGTENDGGSTEGPEEDGPFDTEQEDTETSGGTEDKDAETGDGEDAQPEDGGEVGETGESAMTDNEDEADTENGEGGEGESELSEEPGENEQESALPEEQQDSAAEQETCTVTMPEYYAENVISVQTLENTQTKKLEETITISGIKWQSEPAYDGSTEGTYTFTAVLPEGYTLAEGVSLPQITAAVKESETDSVIKALLERIAALPDAEEYLAAEPELEDEVAYAEWEEKLYEYAEEAFAIMQEYEALTEEQQVIVSEEALAKLTAWVEIAEQLSEKMTTMTDAPVARVTAGGVSTEYADFMKAWEAAQNADSATITLLDNAKVYDTFRVYAGDDIVFEGGEYALIQGSTNRRMIMVEEGAIFTLKSGTFSGSIANQRNGTLYINGGIMESSDGSPVVNVGFCVMSAGEVRGGNNSDDTGIANNGGRLEMRGGTVSGNCGIETTGSLDMSGGAVSGIYGIRHIMGDINVTGGEISGARYGLYEEYEKEPCGITLSGGTFSTTENYGSIYIEWKPNLDVADFLAAGYAYFDTDGRQLTGQEIFGKKISKTVTVGPDSRPELKAHTVTYDYSTNGGTSATKTSASVVEDARIDLTPTASMDGWDFEGWNTDKTAEDGLKSLRMGNEDVTLFAIYGKWIDKEATFYYVKEGECQEDLDPYFASEKLYNNQSNHVKTDCWFPQELLSDETDESVGIDGYTAYGWGESAVSVDEEHIHKEDREELYLDEVQDAYYGVYQKEITVSYDANGGSGSVPVSQTTTTYAIASKDKLTLFTKNEDAVTLPEGSGLTRPGYTFAGWLEGAATGDGKAAGTKVMPTEDVVYYACWEAVAPPGAPVCSDTLPAGWTSTQTTIPLESNSSVGVTELWVRIDDSAYEKVDDYQGNAETMLYRYAVLEGNHTYRFKTKDAAGNESPESDVFTVMLDTTSPAFGQLTYENDAANLLQWIIGKKSMIVHVPVTDTGSGVTQIRYTLTPRNADGTLENGSAETKTAAVKDGEAKITFAANFRGTIAITCTDVAGNAANGVTIGTAGAGGVIVEDTAPDITILADRNPADLQQTQPGGVAVSTGYYDSAPALFVTVKDDTDNAITAGIATVTYQVGNGNGQSVTIGTGTLQEQAVFTIPASEILTGMTEITVTATDNAGNRADKRIIVKVKGPETKPAAEMNYQKEKLMGLVPGEEYLIGGNVHTADGEGYIPLNESWFGSTISIVKKGSGNETADSPEQSLSIPARPAKPTPAGVDVSVAGGTGKLTGLTAGVTYEVSTDGGKTWVNKTADGSGQITGLAPGSYTVRIKAGAVSFASANSNLVTIGAYQIIVTFMVDGQKYKEVSVDYGAALTDIPFVPRKENVVGEWCSDEQGTPVSFANITADMTVYAVYTKAYTVMLQSGTGYTLSAQAGSESPVKEGGSFTFCFTLSSGYRKTADFAVMVNGVKVELKNDTYTITDIREDQTVTVVGVKKTENPPSGGVDNDDGGGSEPTPTPSPQPPQPPAETTASTPAPSAQPTTTPKTTQLVTENESEGRKSETTPEPKETPGSESEESENNETQPPSEPAQTQTSDTTPESQTYTVGKGAVIVTLNNVDETVCTARVADAATVAHAVLSEEALAEAEQGQIIEIRMDVERLEVVPEEDAEVIGKGIEDCQEQISGLVMGMYVDISMYMRIGSGDWNVIHATNEPVEIILDIPDELAGLTADFYIMRAHEGEYLLMEDLDETPETITIQTEAFSTYAILYQMREGDGGKSEAKCSLCHICPTFLGICYFIWLAIIIAVILIIWIVIRRNNRKQDEKEK